MTLHSLAMAPIAADTIASFHHVQWSLAQGAHGLLCVIGFHGPALSKVVSGGVASWPEGYFKNTGNVAVP